MPPRTHSPRTPRSSVRAYSLLLALLMLACGREPRGSESPEGGPKGGSEGPEQLMPTSPLDGALAPDDAGLPGTSTSDGTVPAYVGPAEGPTGREKRAMYIVAHQDDDLGLMNPDLMVDLRSGAAVQTVYMTSGDAGFTCSAYTEGRERGVRAAYAHILGVPDVWDAREVEFAGKLVRVLSLRDTRVALLFVGLHNSGMFDMALPDLERLWSGEAERIETRPYDGRSRIDSYSRTELIEMLTRMMVEFGATHVSTLDSSLLQPLFWPFDHSDHAHSALFALAALSRYERPLLVGMYRAYNFAFEHENVSPSAAAAKLAAFETYMEHDPKICTTGSTVICGEEVPCDDPSVYAGYEQRQYRVIVYQNVRGVLRGPGGQCLQADAAFGPALLVPCDPASSLQLWRVSTDRTIRSQRSDLCLSAAPAVRGSALTLEPCNGQLEQRFLLTAQTQLRGPDATCVQADEGRLTLQECSLDARQMDWNPQSYQSVLTALIDGFTDPDIPSLFSYYGTLSFADVDGDGRGDVCMRRAEGIYCAFSQVAAFVNYGLKLPQFRDSDGWIFAAYGATVQFGDINGDGSADVCGRGRAGVYCATWDDGQHAFVAFQKRTFDTDFSDDKGYAAAVSYYGSLRLADVNADGRADLCGRNAEGIECALSAGDGRFSPASQWTREDFSDALGWRTDATGSTLRFGDVDGDGLLDACGRASHGIRCATNDGAGHFVNAHTWSFTGDFSDDRSWSQARSYYGSIQLVDIDADGRADVCGRSPTGVVCGLSTGSGFSSARPLIATASYGDDEGWSSDRYGSTLGFLDLDFDGVPDLCAWGPDASGRIGLRCALTQ